MPLMSRAPSWRLPLKAAATAAMALAIGVPAQAATSFVIDPALAIDASGYGAGATFSIGSGASLLDLVVTATSASALDDLVLYAQTPTFDFTAVDSARLVSRSAFTPVGGGFGLNYSYTGLSAGQYAFDVFATAGSSVRVVGQSALSPVPEPEVLGLAAVGAVLALTAARKRRAA